MNYKDIFAVGFFRASLLKEEKIFEGEGEGVSMATMI